MTYQIAQLHNMVNDEATENRSMEKQRMVTKLVLAEVMEGMTLIAYVIVFSFAYFGPNSNISGNVRNDYWGFRQVENIDYLFKMMFLLFGIDTFTVKTKLESCHSRIHSRIPPFFSSLYLILLSMVEL